MKDLMIEYSNECDIHVGKLLQIGKLFIGNYGSIVLLSYLESCVSRFGWSLCFVVLGQDT